MTDTTIYNDRIELINTLAILRGTKYMMLSASVDLVYSIEQSQNYRWTRN